MVDLILLPAIKIGFIIGLYEAFVVNRDVAVHTQKFGHGVHAVILSIIFVFCSMNAPFILSLFPELVKLQHIGPNIGAVLGIQLVIGIIAAIKIHGVSHIKGISAVGTRETWFHSILIGTLIVAAPYFYTIYLFFHK